MYEAEYIIVLPNKNQIEVRRGYGNATLCDYYQIWCNDSVIESVYTYGHCSVEKIIVLKDSLYVFYKENENTKCINVKIN